MRRTPEEVIEIIKLGNSVNMISLNVKVNPQGAGAYFTHLPVGWGFSAIP